MSTEKLLEGRLRPIYEYYEFLILIPLAGLIASFGTYIGLLKPVSYGTALIVVGLAIYRLAEGVEVRKYQKSLNSIDFFFIKTDEIKHSHRSTWLGRGFEWTEVHAQRVWDAQKSNLKKYYRETKLFKLARANEKRVELDRAIKPTSIRHRVSDLTQEQFLSGFDLIKFCAPGMAKRYGIDPNVTHDEHGKKLKKPALKPVAKAIDDIKFRNPVAPYSPVMGEPLYHGVGFEDETDQYIDIDDRLGNTIVFGQSRVGKTRLLEVIITQDIERNDGPVVCFDPKGDAELLARMWVEAKRAGREENFYIFALGYPEISARYNAIASFSRVTSVASRITNQMASSKDGVFKDFAWQFLLITAQAMIAIGEKPNFGSVKRYVQDLEPLYLKYTERYLDEHIPDWRAKVHAIKNPPGRMAADGKNWIEGKFTIPPHFKGRTKELVARHELLQDFYLTNPHKINVVIESLSKAIENDKNYYNKITASLIPLLVKLTSGQIAELISPDFLDPGDERPEISWKKIIQSNAVVWCGLDSMTDDEVASAVGNMWFADLVSTFGDIYKWGIDKGLHNNDITKKKPVWIHADEFQSLAGPEFVPLLNRAAGSGARTMCYTQTYSDIEQAFGDAAAANVVLGNFNSLISLRVAQEETAEYICKKVKTADMWGMDLSSNTAPDASQLVDEGEVDTQVKGGKSELGWFKTRSTAAVKIEAREKLITPEMVMSLPRGQAFAHLSGNRLLKLRFPMLEDATGYSPPELADMLADMHEKYERHNSEDYFW